MCAADSTTNMDSDSTIMYNDSETLMDSEGPFFVNDDSSDDNNGQFIWIFLMWLNSRINF